MATVTDNFNRANQTYWGDAGAFTWPEVTGMSISSNTGRCNNTRAFAVIPVDLGSNRHSLSFEFANGTSASYEIGALLQADDTGGASGWGVIMQGGELRVYQVTTGTFGSILAQETMTEIFGGYPTVGETLVAQISDDVITATFGADSIEYTIPNNSYSGNTKAGVWMRGGDIDNLSAGPFSGGMHGGVRWIVQQRNRRRTKGGSYANLR